MAYSAMGLSIVCYGDRAMGLVLVGVAGGILIRLSSVGHGRL